MKTISLDRGFSNPYPSLHSGSDMTQDTIDSGMAFLVGELEKQDPKLREPLTSVTWPRDIPVRTGGGFVDSVATYNVDYATSGGNNDGVQGGAANNIPVMQADIDKDSFRVFIWSHVMKLPFVDQEKMAQIGRSLPDILDKGIHLAHDKKLDVNAYTGLSEFGTTGLVNTTTIKTTTAAPHTASGTDTQWVHKTAVEIMKDINDAITATWQDSEFDVTGMGNHILIPPEQYAYIKNTPVSTAGERSIYTYLMENNIAKDQGVTLSIQPCRWCKGVGTGSTDRMVVYCNNEDRVRFEMTSPLARVTTQASVTEAAYMTLFMSQFSQVEWLYTCCARYVDGI